MKEAIRVLEDALLGKGLAAHKAQQAALSDDQIAKQSWVKYDRIHREIAEITNALRLLKAAEGPKLGGYAGPDPAVVGGTALGPGLSPVRKAEEGTGETNEVRCPTCNSPEPHLHPAIQADGEVQPCGDVFHRRVTAENTLERIKEVDGQLATWAKEQPAVMASRAFNVPAMEPRSRNAVPSLRNDKPLSDRAFNAAVAPTFPDKRTDSEDPE